VGRSDGSLQTAMLLTQQEWDDLAAICGHYAWDVRDVVGDADMTVVTRRAKLCKRIKDAANA
jgi:hypothetical protein